MTRARILYPALLWLLLLAIASCQQEQAVNEVTVPVTVEMVVEVTATPSVTSSPTNPPTATTEPAAVATPTVPPLRATLDALTAKVTFTPRDDANPNIEDDDYPALTQEACDIVRENYVRENFNGVDWDAICEDYQETAATIGDQSALWDLLESLIGELADDHSRFVRPDRFAAEFNLPTEESGRPWPGFILSSARENDQLMLWSVCQIGPAASAGLRRGDVILAINGQEVVRGEDGYDMTALYQNIYRDDADSVALTVLRGPGKEPDEVTIPFGAASGCDGWSYGLLLDSPDPRIGYVRVADFSGGSDENIMITIEQMEAERPLDGLIVDVRHNPGGNSDSDIAIFAAGTFGTYGALREGAIQTTFRVRGPARWNETTPVVVLTDGASHSAAEYFATAMQQSGRATLVGMPTAGNTEGITGYNLTDGSLIRLASGTLTLPDGNTLEGVGVIPDVEVPLGKWGLREVPDIQLQEAIDILLEQI
jgi:C-terminal peptidase prc